MLVFANTCRPGTGSESGAGWGLVETALDLADCTLFGHPVDAPALAEWVAAHPGSGLSVEVVPDPAWGRALRFHRIGRFLTYLAWLRAARRRASGLVAAGGFDLAWHVTYSVYWLPSPVGRLGLPSVWGPVGGGVTAPASLRPVLGWRGWLSERLDAVSVRAMAALPATRRTWREADVRLIQNEATFARLTPAVQAGASILNHALFTVGAGRHAGRPGGPVVWAGHLQRRKGPTLAVRALAAAGPSVRMQMYGEGPERRRIERLAARLGVADRLEMMGRVPRSELLEALTGCGCAMFTGLYEEGGLALAEALATGLPTVVVDNGGAGTIARWVTDPSRVSLVPPGTVAETAERLGAAATRFVTDPPPGTGPLLDRDAAVAALTAAFREALASG